MLIGGLFQPSMASHGDFWFNFATRDLYEYHVTNAGTLGSQGWLLVGAGRYTSTNPPPVHTQTSLPSDPIWIDMNDPDRIPHLWNAGSWVPVVPKTFQLPQLPAAVGDIWFNMNTLDGYTYDGTTWVLSQPAQALQFSSTASPKPALLSISAPTPPAANALTITGLVKIYMDGRIEYDPSYTPDAAAKVLWEAIATMSPAYQEGEEVKKLRKQIKYAEDRGFKFPKPAKAFDPNDAWDAAMGVVG